MKDVKFAYDGKCQKTTTQSSEAEENCFKKSWSCMCDRIRSGWDIGQDNRVVFHLLPARNDF